MIEYLEDLIAKHPEQEFVAREGEGIRILSGDPWFDQMDARVAAGEEITFEDLGLPPEEIALLKKKAAQARAAALPAPAQPTEKPVEEDPPIEDFEDTYHA